MRCHCVQSGDLEQQPGRTIMESFENQVNQVLNKARDDAGNMAQVGAGRMYLIRAM
jgi:DNA-directed RNA polymerase II subunit RPB1